MANNSTKKFKFISPGVFVDEIDQSQLPATPTEVGPVVIGRSRKGPANKAISVNSYSEFVQTFGNPVPGNEGGDIWREGNNTAPTYAPFAAKAWLRNNSPLTFVRVLGDQSSGATDANGGKAGWEVNAAGTVPNGGVYALVVFPSSSQTTADPAAVTGAIAAQFYTNGRVLLNNGVSDVGCTLVEVATDDDFQLTFITGSSSSTLKLSLDPNSPNFIRTVLNTNPTITNSAITEAATRTYYQGGFYWLGESFEYSSQNATAGNLGLISGGDTTKYQAAILPMAINGTNTSQQNNWRAAATKGTTGWFISQDLSDNHADYTAHTQQRLFRLEALTAGEWAQREVKISISNIKAPTGNFQSYGSFSVLVRALNDTDNRQVILERYDELNLNPASENYIAKRIGDKYCVYNATEQRNVDYGEFENQSNYIRVVMSDDVAAGSGETRWLPFGVFGPTKYRDVSLTSGSAGFQNFGTLSKMTVRGNVDTMLDGANSATYGTAGYTGNTGAGVLDVSIIATAANNHFTGSIRFPGVPLRLSSTNGSPKNTKSTFWGAWTGRSRSDTFFNPEITDMLRARSFDASDNTNPADPALDIEGVTATNSGSSAIVIPWVFSLDNVSGSVSEGYAYNNAYRSTGVSLSAVGSNNYTTPLGLGIDRFTTTLFGGFDGLDITEREPFRNSGMSDKTETTSYEIYSLKKAINIVSDPDDVSMNAITIPGITEKVVTNDLLDTAEERGDALAIIDIPNAYVPDTEALGNSQTRNATSTVTAAVTNIQGRNLNNSYGATYYPWVSILDTESNQRLWAPPSVAALGVLSNTDRLQAPWFAPAGFTRGGLSEGAAGVPVLDVSQRLTSDDRDDLYENNINPIAKFPAEGIVIFGQKTLQQTASALDRINVRRLMIFLKREISFIASRLLFAPNAQATWDRFLGQAEPILRDVKSQFGIDDFRLILDESTTTPDLIDRNIIYAKLYVKPTRAVEFFAIDFIITNSGASFED
jgi:hypothetical protein